MFRDEALQAVQSATRKLEEMPGVPTEEQVWSVMFDLQVAMDATMKLPSTEELAPAPA